MSEAPVRHPPLDPDAALTVATTRIVPWQPGAIVNLRGRAAETGFADAVGEAVGGPLPVVPNTLTRGQAVTLLWLGPDEWLVVADADAASPMPALRAAVGGRPAAVTAADCSYAGLELAGSEATAVLARGTPLDLHPGVFVTGCCAQTRLAKADVTLWRGGDAPVLRCLVRRSMARYLWRWCEAVCQRMNVPVRAGHSGAL